MKRVLSIILIYILLPLLMVAQDTQGQTVYEASPQARPLEQVSPGAAWSSHPVQTEYLRNELSGEYACKKYTVNASGTLVEDGVYPSGELSVVKNISPDGNVLIVFTDKQGRKLLSRQSNGTSYHDTYNIQGALTWIAGNMFEENI